MEQEGSGGPGVAGGRPSPAQGPSKVPSQAHLSHSDPPPPRPGGTFEVQAQKTLPQRGSSPLSHARFPRPTFPPSLTSLSMLPPPLPSLLPCTPALLLAVLPWR